MSSLTHKEQYEKYQRALIDYEYACKMHKIDVGLIGRFFEKLFGTNWYTICWSEIKSKHGIDFI